MEESTSIPSPNPSQAPVRDTPVEITLTLAEWRYILDQLEDRPYKEVFKIIGTVWTKLLPMFEK